MARVAGSAARARRDKGKVAAAAVLILALFLSAACGALPAAPEDASSPAAAASEEQQASSVEANVAPGPETDAAEEGEWASVATLEGEYFVRGNPAAPVRLIDYSDFL
jgi:protein-disulfide isomerase